MTTSFNRDELIDALVREYEFLCHDDYDPDLDPSPEEYRHSLQFATDDQLLAEASDDDIEEFLSAWSTLQTY